MSDQNVPMPKRVCLSGGYEIGHHSYFGCTKLVVTK